MDIKKLEVIESASLASDKLTDKEKEVALKILNDLQGTLVIRATSILKFCLEAIQYTEIKGNQQ